MKALVFRAPLDMAVEHIGIRKTRRGEVRVRVTYAGVCGTDVRIYRGTKKVDGPRVIGHEFIGVVDEIGPDVIASPMGTRVAVYPIVACGTCYACRDNRKNICLHRRTFGYEIDGGFAEYVTVVAEAVSGGNIIPIPDEVSDVAAAASEPVAAALQGIVRGGVRPGQTVLIMGAGPIGVAHVELSRLMGARCIIVSEPQAARRAIALQHGANDAIDPLVAPLADQLSPLIGEEGPDVAFVDTSVPQLIRGAVEVLRKGGRCVIFAGMPVESIVEVDPNVIHYREVDLVGSSGSTPELQARVLRYAADKRIDLESLVTEEVPIEEWRRAFSRPEDDSGLKVLFNLTR
jgi:L-iditol 2-dehydrogenase